MNWTPGGPPEAPRGFPIPIKKVGLYPSWAPMVQSWFYSLQSWFHSLLSTAVYGLVDNKRDKSRSSPIPHNMTPKVIQESKLIRNQIACATYIHIYIYICIIIYARGTHDLTIKKPAPELGNDMNRTMFARRRRHQSNEDEARLTDRVFHKDANYLQPNVSYRDMLRKPCAMRALVHLRTTIAILLKNGLKT